MKRYAILYLATALVMLPLDLLFLGFVAKGFFSSQVGEMLGMCIYLQGDVLLLGFLTDSTTVGYYTLTVTVTVALAAVGQSYGMTFYEPLRRSDGD